MNKVSIAIALSAVFACNVALAASSKRENYSIESSEFREVQLEMSIGEMEIEVYDGDSIEIDIELIAKRRWFSFQRGEVDDIELEQREQGDSLYLGIDDDGLDQTWHVRLPAHLALDVEVGVGDIRIDNFSNSLLLDLGVGAVEVNLTTMDYREVAVSAGVGDAVIRGFGRGTDNERNLLVGADAYYQGEGQYNIEIEVGVGDAQVRAR